jgi:hypothetical protein
LLKPLRTEHGLEARVTGEAPATFDLPERIRMQTFARRASLALLLLALVAPAVARADTITYRSGTAKPLDMDVVEIANGNCRNCAPPANNETQLLGHMRLTLTQPERTVPATTANRATIDITRPGGTHFQRSDAPITLISQPPGT